MKLELSRDSSWEFSNLTCWIKFNDNIKKNPHNLDIFLHPFFFNPHYKAGNNLFNIKHLDIDNGNVIYMKPETKQMKMIGIFITILPR